MTTTPPVRRVPVRKDQYQVGIVEEMTGVNLDVSFCAVSGHNRGVQLHHVVFRSHGGTAGPVIPICQSCHDKIHDRIWEVRLNEDGIQVLDFVSGEVIWRQMAWKIEGFRDAGDLLAVIEQVSDLTALMPRIAPALKADEALEYNRALRRMQDSSWKAQCRLIGEMFRYRFPGRTEGERIQALVDAFGLQKSQIYNLLSVYREFGESSVLDESPLSQSFFVEASRTEEPIAWLHLAEERKLVHPQFHADDLKAEIRAKQHADDLEAAALGMAPMPTAPEPEAKPPTRVWGRALRDMKSGEAGWFEKLPVGSDGVPVDIEEYRE